MIWVLGKWRQMEALRCKKEQKDKNVANMWAKGKRCLLFKIMLYKGVKHNI